MIWRYAAIAASASVALAGCRSRDILSVPAPAGVVAGSTIQSQAGVESAFNTARFQTFTGLAGMPNFYGLAGYQGGVLEWSSVLTDEYTWGNTKYDNSQLNVDARITPGALRGFTESGDQGVQTLLTAESSLLFAIPGLRQYEPPSGRSKVGEAFALAGYAELVMAEDYCAGVPLGRVLAGGGYQYGTALTTDSLLGTAEAHFDSAVANTNGDPTIQGLASVGLARARLNRGHYAAAASAVAGVPSGFVYNAQLPPSYGDGGVKAASLYGYLYNYQSYLTGYLSGSLYSLTFINAGDREGGTGLNFVSAHDPRLVFDTSLGPTPDGVTWYFPKKFEANLSYVPLATGIEARLIEAEAALDGGDPAGWATALDALRSDSGDTHVSGMPALSSDSTTGASSTEQVDVMFRERAFWLFGTGTRLGDLRRLIRQYGRAPDAVFPSGPYVSQGTPAFAPFPPATYGADVNLTLPTAAGGSIYGYTTTDPNYKGCLNKNA